MDQVKKDLQMRIGNTEEDNIIKLERIQRENQEQVNQTERIVEKFESVSIHINKVHDQAEKSKENIVEIRQELIQLQEKLEIIKNRPYTVNTNQSFDSSYELQKL